MTGETGDVTMPVWSSVRAITIVTLFPRLLTTPQRTKTFYGSRNSYNLPPKSWTDFYGPRVVILQQLQSRSLIQVRELNLRPHDTETSSTFIINTKTNKLRGPQHMNTHSISAKPADITISLDLKRQYSCFTPLP